MFCGPGLTAGRWQGVVALCTGRRGPGPACLSLAQPRALDVCACAPLNAVWWQVPELKKALEERGLDTKGLKAELVDRLKAALIADGAQQGDTGAPAAEVPKAQGDEAPKAEPEPEPAAADPVPTDPVPTDPAPTEPVAAEPVAAEPVAPLAATDAPAKSEADGAPAASLVEAKVAGEPSELSPPSVAAPMELPKQVISEGAAEVEPSTAAASVTTASDVPPSAAAPEHETNKRPREDDEGAGDDSKRAKPEEGGDSAAPPAYQPPAAAEQAGYAAGAEQSYTQPGQVLSECSSACSASA